MKENVLERRMLALLERRKRQHAFRSASYRPELVDFCSNDYLGLARQAPALPDSTLSSYSGATGSRLLSGHYPLLEELEALLCTFHQAPAALVFNSGYNANLSLLAALPRRSDVILYDELVHASIHDGLKLSAAQAIPFPHNDLEALQDQLKQQAAETVFVVVESVYSMDGDQAPLKELADMCTAFGAALIVDEAHSTGSFGHYGEGLCTALGIQEQVFARVYTFGKAIGSHGAAVAGSRLLYDYLFNYARPLIYTTTLPPHTIQTVLAAYQELQTTGEQLLAALRERIQYFKDRLASILTKVEAHIQYIESSSPIQCLIIPGNAAVSQVANRLQAAGFDVRPIRKPTVAAGQERLRICLHVHNTSEELEQLLIQLAQALAELPK